MSWAWWCMPVIPALGRLKWDDWEFKASLGYIVRLCLKKNIYAPYMHTCTCTMCVYIYIYIHIYTHICLTYICVWHTCILTCHFRRGLQSAKCIAGWFCCGVNVTGRSHAGCHDVMGGVLSWDYCCVCSLPLTKASLLSIWLRIYVEREKMATFVTVYVVKFSLGTGV
jgi:hypothetical protein